MRPVCAACGGEFSVFRYIPILWAARASTWQYSLLGGYRDWIGADHYLRALEDPILLKSLQVTFTYVLVKLPLEVALALALAIFTNQVIRDGTPCAQSSSRRW